MPKKEIISIEDHWRVWWKFLANQNPHQIANDVGRPFKSIRVLPWKIAINYEGKGLSLVRYLRTHPRIKIIRRMNKWTSREISVLKWRHDNPVPRLADPLSVEDIGFLLGRTKGAARKQIQAMYPAPIVGIFF